MSADAVEIGDILFMTSEHAYQWTKFSDTSLKEKIRNARSGYDSKMIALEYKNLIRADWNEVKLEIMESTLRKNLINIHTYKRNYSRREMQK